jgi:hypothetical protein
MKLVVLQSIIFLNANPKACNLVKWKSPPREPKQPERDVFQIDLQHLINMLHPLDLLLQPDSAFTGPSTSPCANDFQGRLYRPTCGCFQIRNLWHCRTSARRSTESSATIEERVSLSLFQALALQRGVRERNQVLLWRSTDFCCFRSADRRIL